MDLPRMTDELRKLVREYESDPPVQEELELSLDKGLDIEDLCSSEVISSERRLAGLEKLVTDLHRQQSAQRENTRNNIVLGILGLAAIVIVGSGTMVGLAAFSEDEDSDLIMGWTQICMLTLTNFGSTALGFYFGTQKSKD